MTSPIAADFQSWRVGHARDATPKTKPGTVLMGGGADVDDAFKWLIDRAGHGDVLALRTEKADGYNPYLMGLSAPNSVETLLLRSRRASSNPEVVNKIRHAEAIWFTGGDQKDYLRYWKHTPMMRAINDAIARGVPIGGTSAGLAILGGHVFFSTIPGYVTSAETLANPYDRRIHLTTGMVDVPALAHVLAETHFSERDRMGRLITFLARLESQGKMCPARGIGVDQATAITIDDNGMGTVMGDGHVYLVETTEKPSVCRPGQPLSIAHVHVRRLSAGDHFDFRTWSSADGTTGEAFVEHGLLRVVMR